MNLRRVLEFTFGFVPALVCFLIGLWGVHLLASSNLLLLPAFLPIGLIALLGSVAAMSLMVTIWFDGRVRYKTLHMLLHGLGILLVLISVFEFYLVSLFNEITQQMLLAVFLSVSIVTVWQLFKLSRVQKVGL